MEQLAIQAYNDLNYEILCSYVTAKMVYDFYIGGMANFSASLLDYNLSFI